jgi:hypothetical protein
MRAARILAASIIAAVLVASATVPAVAQTWVSLRYWPTNVNVNLTGGPSGRSWDTGMISLALRRDLPNNWAVSLTGDWGSQGNWAQAWTGATSGSDSLWSINVHRNFPMTTGVASVFLGYANAGWGTVFPPFPASQTRRYSGLTGGVDFRSQRGPWSVAAWAGIGITGTTTADWPGVVPGPQSTPGTYSDAGVTVGHMLPGGWTFDVGYRQVKLGHGATANFLATEATWSGWMLGVSRTFP